MGLLPGDSAEGRSHPGERSKGILYNILYVQEVVTLQKKYSHIIRLQSKIILGHMN